MKGIVTIDEIEDDIWRLYNDPTQRQGEERPAEYYYNDEGWLRRRSKPEWRSLTEIEAAARGNTTEP